MIRTKYKAKTLSGAERRVRTLERLLEDARKDRDLWKSRAESWHGERRVLAKLAADTPHFWSPLDAANAKRLRDTVLAQSMEVKP
jgi:hypothetical protein